MNKDYKGRLIHVMIYAKISLRRDRIERKGGGR